jgi:tetratricopeptide (TPR) repeat protein
LIAVKVAEAESAEECVAALKGEAQRLISGSRQQQEFAFEALLLDANLQQRRGAHDQARLKYEAARTLADTALGDRDRGRVAQELAWAAAERNERALAENLYREAIRLLGGVAGSPDDRVWTSALGRALRDYADLIAKEDGRGAHAKQLLRRAMAIHALDGRYDQLAPALQTLGRVAAAARDWEAGEQALRTAVAMFLAAGNVPGWVSAMRGLAEIAEMQGFPEPARRILERVLERLRSKSNMDKEIGVVALDLARVLWRLGEFEAVVQSCKEADRALPLEMRERSLLSNLMRCAESLIPPVEEPSKRGEG